MKKVLSIIMCAIMAVTCISLSASAKKVTIKAPKLTSVVQTDLNVAKVNWIKVSGAKGYILYYSTNGRSYKRLTTTSKKNYVHKKLTTNKKYYYKLKSYKKVGGRTIYSKFSNIKTVRCTNYLVNIYKPYSGYWFQEYKNGNYFKMGGERYSNGLTLEENAIYNLKGKYKYISFTYGHVDDSYDDTRTLEIYSDDKLVFSTEVSGTALPKTKKINIQNANKLEFSMEHFWGYPKIGLANIRLYK